MKTIHINKRRYGFDIVNTQFFIIPTIGIIHREINCSFAIGLAWLNILFCIKFRPYIINLPLGNCDNFDYQIGCLGHEKESRKK